MPWQKGIGHRWPLDQERTARISSGGGEREELVGTVALAAVLHGRRHGSMNREHREREGAGDLGQADTAAGGHGQGGGRHGRWSGAIGRTRIEP